MAQFVACRLRCPVCVTEFVADEIHGAVPVAHETDFRPLYDGPDPLLSHLHSCPGCHYSAYREGFETEPADEDELLEWVEDDPRSLPRSPSILPDDNILVDLRRYVRSAEFGRSLVAAGREPFGAERYLLAARVHDFLSEDDPFGHLHFTLRAAWCARGAGDDALDRTLLRRVQQELNPLLGEGQALDPMERVRLLYLAGEAARRTGDFARAADDLSTVEKEADPDDPEGAFLSALARRQGLLALVKSSVSAKIPPELPQQHRWGGDGEEGENLDEDDGESSLN